MTQDDDRIWLEALAGRSGGDRSPVAREAEALRAGILARVVVDDPPVDAVDAAREDELIERAARVGLLPRLRRDARGVWWTPWRGALAAAALGGLVVAIGLVTRPAVEPQPVLRAPAGVVRLEADDPLRLQRQILSELRDLGVPATGYERLDRRGVDADLPQPIPADVRSVLARHGIPLPDDSVLRVEIAAKAAP